MNSLLPALANLPLKELHLCLSNSVSISGSSVLLNTLKTLQTLTAFTLDLSNSKSVSDTDSYNIVDTISYLPSLEQLTLGFGSCIFFRDRALKKLSTHLQSHKLIWKLQLFLWGTKVTDEGIKSLAKAIQNLHQIRVFNLTLGATSISDQGVAYLATSLNTSHRLSQLYLGFSGCRLIGDRGVEELCNLCLLYTSPSPRDRQKSRMPSSA
eukprot:TRINITY_DN4728_c0_g1_i4.p1 TRINITY_DN4728_c0_g1~~TRINITY_DN4728_c0_g1_i4.p1  ORF type:complete len:210 (-),score=25.13 TRINITY_DN4728_c0_g1_i4:11-640(-)